MTGQINFEDNPLGKHIVEICSKPDVNTIIEVGTWNGCGTTRCILEGVKNKPKDSYIVKSYECSPEMYEQAVRNNQNIIHERFQLLFGKLVEENLITTWFDVGQLTWQQNEWLKQDINWMSNVPNLLHTVPEKIDFLILDGGEYATYIEWLALKDRFTYCALDDVNVLKCAKIREEVLGDPQYEIIEDNAKVNYGFMVFKRK